MLAARKQRIIMWWFLALLTVTAVAWITLLGEFPPPSGAWSAERLAHWYQIHHTRILAGSTICGWTSAFSIQFAIVVWAQMRRVEVGAKIWSTLMLVSGSITAVFVALPAIAFGAAAYGSERAPEVTQVMHHLAVLCMVTTDQLYIGGWVAVVVICFTTPDSPSNPFPRWWGWLTLWTIVLYEPGAVAFVAKTGLFSVNGILAFWLPSVIFALWMVGQVVMIFRALKVQETEEEDEVDLLDIGAPTPSTVSNGGASRAGNGGASRAEALSTRK